MTEKNFSLFHIVLVLLKKKVFFIANGAAVFGIAIVISLYLPKSYKSSVVFIPPGQSGSNLLSMIGTNFTPDLLSDSKYSKRQYTELLRSREIREKVITEFNLLDVYKLRDKPYGLDVSLKILDKCIMITEKDEGGLGITDIIAVELTVIDGKPQRASDIANFLFESLEKKVIDINNREINFQIAFLNQQMRMNDSILDKARLALKSFQVNNKMYDVSSQVKLTVGSIAQLEADKMSLELQKAYLQKSVHPQFSEMNALNEKLSICNQKIFELEKQYTSGILPGMQRSLDLGNEYVDLLKEVETYLQLKFLLRQQLELAKLKQQKGFTGISLVDPARPAQYKFKPKRAFVVLSLTFIYMMILISIVLFRDYCVFLRRTHPEKIDALLNAIIKKQS